MRCPSCETRCASTESTCPVCDHPLERSSPDSNSQKTQRKKKRRKKRTSSREVYSWGAATLLLGVVNVVLLVVATSGHLVATNLYVACAMVTVLGIANFTVCDQFYRRRIRQEIESYGGRIKRIAWLPFQGMFFSKGWKRERCYQVSYTDRDGQNKSDLCGISLIWGSRWGDDV